MKYFKYLLLSSLFLSNAYSSEGTPCFKSILKECLKIHTTGYCEELAGSCNQINSDKKQKKNSLKGFQTLKITSSLDGRFFKSGKLELTVKGVEYPAIRCELESGDLVYIVANLVEESTISKIKFIKVYNLEKDLYCDLM